MRDKEAVFAEMKRLSPDDGTRLLSVYTSTSVSARSEWYANIGHEVLETTDEHIVASGGFTTEHFSEERLRGLLDPCKLHAIGDIAYLAQC